METCSLEDFMQAVKPWLSSEYIRAAYMDEKNNFVLQFLDGVKNVYRISDCTREQLQKILADFGERGIPVGSPDA